MKNELNIDKNNRSLSEALSTMVLRVAVFFSVVFAGFYIFFSGYSEFSDFQNKAYNEFKLSFTQVESHLSEIQAISEQIAKFVNKVARYNSNSGDINSESKELIKLYLNQLLDSSGYPLVAAIVYSSEIPPMFVFQTGVYSDLKYQNLVFKSFSELINNKKLVDAPIGLQIFNLENNFIIASKSKEIIYGNNSKSHTAAPTYPQNIFVTLLVKEKYISDFANKQIFTASQRGIKIGINISINNLKLYENDFFHYPIDYAISKKFSEKIPLLKADSSGTENYLNYSLNISSFDNFLIFVLKTLSSIVVALIFIFGIYLVVKRKLPSHINPLLKVVSDIEELELSSYQKQMPVLGPKEIFLIRDIIEKMRIKILKVATLESQTKLAKQVAHDIRSPLSALNIITSTLTDVPEEKRLLIRNSVQRINDIANDLLQKGKSAASASSNFLDFGPESGMIAATSKNASDIAGNNSAGLNTSEKNLSIKQNYCFLVSTVVDNIVSEKRIQYREKINVHINVDLKKSFGLFVNANPNELSRVISNLVNNSVEALPNQSGNVDVSVFDNSENKICIQIKDNGSGIPKHILAKLGQAGVTHGKDNTQSGSGLGVYHAMKTIQEIGGEIIFQSVTVDDLASANVTAQKNTTGFAELDIKSNLVNKTGTTITIELQKADTPSWFAESIQLIPGQEYVTVDDDISIHQIWKGRLQSLKSNEQNIQLTSFTSAKEFREYFNKNLNSNPPRIFLIDYEFLNQNDNGLKIITDLGIQNRAILVTSRFDEPNIRSECEAQNIKILPKQLAGQIPISISNGSPSTNENNDVVTTIESLSNSLKLSKCNLCLIDDDKLLVHSIWGMVAKEKGLNIRMFERPEDFLSQANQIDKSTPIYVDVSLGDNVNGIDVANVIHEQGFENINLATGYESESIKVPNFIRQVVGKDFPNL